MKIIAKTYFVILATLSSFTFSSNAFAGISCGVQIGGTLTAAMQVPAEKGLTILGFSDTKAFAYRVRALRAEIQKSPQGSLLRKKVETGASEDYEFSDYAVAIFIRSLMLEVLGPDLQLEHLPRWKAPIISDPVRDFLHDFFESVPSQYDWIPQMRNLMQAVNDLHSKSDYAKEYAKGPLPILLNLERLDSVSYLETFLSYVPRQILEQWIGSLPSLKDDLLTLRVHLRTLLQNEPGSSKELYHRILKATSMQSHLARMARFPLDHNDLLFEEKKELRKTVGNILFRENPGKAFRAAFTILSKNLSEDEVEALLIDSIQVAFFITDFSRESDPFLYFLNGLSEVLLGRNYSSQSISRLMVCLLHSMRVYVKNILADGQELDHRAIHRVVSFVSQTLTQYEGKLELEHWGQLRSEVNRCAIELAGVYSFSQLQERLPRALVP